jgi:hypothetical protein
MTVSTLTGIFLLIRLWRARQEAGAASLIWAILCMAFWSLTYIFEIISPNVGKSSGSKQNTWQFPLFPLRFSFLALSSADAESG